MFQTLGAAAEKARSPKVLDLVDKGLSNIWLFLLSE